MRILVTSARIGNICNKSIPTQQGHDVTFICLDSTNFAPRSKSMTARMVSKIPKMLAWDLYPGYDMYIWMDSNFNFTTNKFADWFVKRIGDKQALFFKHPHGRTTIKSEADFLINQQAKGDRYLIDRCFGEDIQNQIDTYLKDPNFVDNKLMACGIFAYKASVVENRQCNLMKEWYYNVCRWNIRDQVSLPYALSKFDISYELINDNIYDFEKIVSRESI
jgi:hypothetical protein